MKNKKRINHPKPIYKIQRNEGRNSHSLKSKSYFDLNNDEINESKVSEQELNSKFNVDLKDDFIGISAKSEIFNIIFENLNT